jgi:hypothetical protein
MTTQSCGRMTPQAGAEHAPGIKALRHPCYRPVLAHRAAHPSFHRSFSARVSLISLSRPSSSDPSSPLDGHPPFTGPGYAFHLSLSASPRRRFSPSNDPFYLALLVLILCVNSRPPVIPRILRSGSCRLSPQGYIQLKSALLCGPSPRSIVPFRHFANTGPQLDSGRYARSYVDYERGHLPVPRPVRRMAFG